MRRPLLLAVVLVLAGCSSSHPKAAPTPSVTVTTSYAPAPPSPSAPTSAAASSVPPPSPVAPVAPLTAGFVETDLSWISADQGFVLGTVPSPPGDVAADVRTTLDGGKTWRELTKPTGDTCGPQNGRCLDGIRFVTPSTGYVWGQDGFFLTTDGGKTGATQTAANIQALEPSPTDVLRVVYPNASCSLGGGATCPLEVQRSDVAGAAWTKVYGADVPGSLEFTRSGSTWALLFGGNEAGGVGSAARTLVVSVRGAAPVTHGDPCAPQDASGNEMLADGITADGAGDLLVYCHARSGSQVPTAVLSTDGGATFAAPHPLDARTQSVDLFDAQHLLAYTVGAAAGMSGLGVQTSSNGGATFAQTAMLVASGTNGAGVLGVQNTTAARWSPGPDVLFTTRDAGKTWAQTSYDTTA